MLNDGLLSLLSRVFWRAIWWSWPSKFSKKKLTLLISSSTLELPGRGTTSTVNFFFGFSRYVPQLLELTFFIVIPGSRSDSGRRRAPSIEKDVTGGNSKKMLFMYLKEYHSQKFESGMTNLWLLPSCVSLDGRWVVCFREEPGLNMLFPIQDTDTGFFSNSAGSEILIVSSR